MSPPPKKRQPLTREQQTTVTQWRPLAIKYMLKALHGLGLGHYEDEATGLAAEALMGAVYVWNPKRGSFASCLKWWVLSVAKTFSAHGARTVHQSGKAREHVDSWSLNAPLERTGGALESGEWQDLLADDSVGDPSVPVDAPRLIRAAAHVLPRLVAGPGAKAKELRYARESVRIWGLRAFGEEEPEDVTLEKLGQEIGVSRERIRQREAKVQRVFEQWAAGIRKEAA